MRKASGARALFGEKYGDEVRVVSMGLPLGSDPSPSSAPNIAGSDTRGLTPNRAWSVELCGGTHVKRTGDIGLVKVVAESASAAGVRRIEALTAEGARNYLAEADERLKEAAALLKTRPDDVIERLKSLVEERKTLERQLADAKKQIALGGGAATGAGGRGGGECRAHHRRH